MKSYEEREADDAAAQKRMVKSIAKWGLLGTASLLGLCTVLGGFYTVAPSEMAGLRLFNKVEVTKPIGPGLHFKLPWVESVDKLQVSMTKFGVDNLKVYTVDNQPIKISISITYDIPQDQVLHLLYDVGSAGNFDTFHTIEPVIADRAMRVFSQENTVSISEDRAKLDNEIEKEVRDSVGQMFGLNIRDLQITAIEYSPTFEQSIDAAVQAKNAAIKAGNVVNQRKFEAESAKIIAQGQAQAAIQQAEGQAQSRLLKAQAEAKAVILEGDARAKAAAAVGAAVAANPQIVPYEIAQKWNGGLPMTMLGGGALPFINLPTTASVR